MNLPLLVWRNLWKKPLASLLSIILFALGTTIILSISTAQESLKNQVKKSAHGVDMVLGAKGSPLQLVLSTLFHIDFPTGNISLESAQKVFRNPLVKEFLHISIGDNFQGYRIIGIGNGFSKWFSAEMEEGKLWEGDFEAVIGSNVAEKNSLKIGDQFQSSHGFAGEGMKHDQESFKVVGILSRSNSVNDRLIFCSLKTIWHVHGLEKESDPQITASLIKFRNPGGIVGFPRALRNYPNLMVASPAFELNRLFLVFEPLIDFLNVLAWIIIGISMLSILFALYNTLQERIYEISLIRVMGASRVMVFLSLLLEGLYLAIVGFIVGDLLARGISLVLVSWLLPGFSGMLTSFSISVFEISLFLLVMVMGILSALVPAFIGARKDISRVLFSE
jgi:putative ABC transport system permease protein